MRIGGLTYSRFFIQLSAKRSDKEAPIKQPGNRAGCLVV